MQSALFENTCWELADAWTPRAFKLPKNKQVHLSR